jgi:DNA-binding winged helix-turn-helix (wHTH) protein/TolB-like protein/Tfp pilus assembly protein PilF
MRKLAARYNTYSFSDFTLDLARGSLLRDGQELKLRPKVFDALCYLVENNNRLVSKDELIKAVWPDSFVTDDSLVQCLVELRRALCDDNQAYIKTVPRRGYIFTAQVKMNPAADRVIYVEEVESLKVVIEEANAGHATLADSSRTESACASSVQALAEASSIAPAEIETVAAASALSTRGYLTSRIKRHKTSAAVVASILVLAIAGILYSSLPPAGKAIDSLAVLPFKSIDGQGREEPLELGMADALATQLSDIQQMKVRPASAAFRYAGQNVDPRQAGQELKVAAVLEGSIQRQGERVRVSAQLVYVADGRTLWADKFDTHATDYFAMQDVLSGQITRSLTRWLTGTEQNPVAKRGTSSEAAYELQLKGRYWFGKNTADGLQKAIDYYSQAIAIDQTYALPYSGLVDAYSVQAANALKPPLESFLKAKAAAEKAVELDDGSADVHISLGHLKLLTWDWAGAEKEFQRVVEINPPYPTAHIWYSVYLTSLGRHQQALALIINAQEQNPISFPINEAAERAHFFARQYDEAIAAGMKNLELEPNRTESLYWLALAYEQKGMYDEAVAAELKILSLRGVKPEDTEVLRAAYVASGWRGYWLKRIERAREAAKHRYVSPVGLAQMYARIGDKESAFEFLRQAYSEHSDQLIRLKVDPVFDALRSDSRYMDLVRRVGFPQ